METEGILSKVTGGPRKQGSSSQWHHQSIQWKQLDKGYCRTWVQNCQHPLAVRVSQQIMLPKRSFPFPHRKSLLQEHDPVNGLELCTLPNQLKQPFTYTPSAAAYL